ncbi:MAG: 1,4-dihydroxy-6-naphthoate synthase [Pirellulaceae bacterium]
MKIKIGISTCPNDTFAFHGLLTGEVKIPGIELDFQLLDIEQLNEGVIAEAFDVAKASFHLALHVADRYWVMPSGSALGFGVGPLLLSSENHRSPNEFNNTNATTLCPGRYTTASLLFQLFYPHTTAIKQVVFSEIMPSLKNKSAEFGVCIHEGRFTWEEQGLFLVEDLGTRWENETKLPLPLGGLLASRDLPPEVIDSIQLAIAQSIRNSKQHPDRALISMRRYAQEFDDDVLMQHVDLYVNDWTIDLGMLGASALKKLNDMALRTGLVTQSDSGLEIFQATV